MLASGIASSLIAFGSVSASGRLKPHLFMSSTTPIHQSLAYLFALQLIHIAILTESSQETIPFAHVEPQFPNTLCNSEHVVLGRPSSEE
jgi:hypothetical protein